ncbi:MAG: hypothetical protein OHK93_002641 [Ramalina farinacea]|uniref:PLAC8 family protein n=1 Tax=Ramalina farinacea TaxID=258253 RepID=A0AA43U0J4_9LECA|nr:hypothetical protein [Ramalina farinacea]
MTAPTQKSAMQHDVDHWVVKAQNTMKDPSGITNPTGSTEWTTGFFSCFQPIDLCAITCCCPCITFGKTHHRLNKDARLAGYSPVNASVSFVLFKKDVCLGWWGLSCFGLHCIPNLLQRHDVRTRSVPNLSGNFVTDFLKQDKEAEHLLSMETTQVHMQPPMANEGMSYAPH